MVLEADFDFFEPVGDHHLKVDRHVHVEHIDGSDVLGQERGLLAGQPLSRLQQGAELLDHFLGQSPIGRCAVGGAWRIVAEVLGQAPVLKHVDGEPCELGVRECGPQVPQDLGFGSVMKGVGVDTNAVVHEVSEGAVRVVQDVSAAHLEQVLELLPQRVISDGHEHQPCTAHSTMNDGLTVIRPFCFTYGRFSDIHPLKLSHLIDHRRMSSLPGEAEAGEHLNRTALRDSGPFPDNDARLGKSRS